MEREFYPITIRTVDQAVKDWLDKTVSPVVIGADGTKSVVPSIFSQGERWAIGRTRGANHGALRDENGVLMLPVMAVRRVSMAPDITQLALGVQTENIQISRRVDPAGKSGDLQSLERLKSAQERLPYDPVVYEVRSIPFPDRIIVDYQLVVQTQYITQMNDIIQKIWRMLDIQRSFVMPIMNDGRHPPRATGYQDPRPIDRPYLVGFFEDSFSDTGNFEEFTEQERVIKYTTSFSVPAALSTSPDGTEPVIRVERTAYKVSIPEENVRFVDDPAELDKIFGSK
jgi:hypothetical protein